MKVLFLSINSAYKIAQIYIHISDDDKLLNNINNIERPDGRYIYKS